MIPIRLTLSGFLSYQQEVTLDFGSFDLACISGTNGAGKSSLLDAITWVLFGKARKTDDSIINLHPTTTAAQVTFDFEYEGNRYRVQRTNPRGKTTLLEFQIQTNSTDPPTWKTLSERTSRGTQSKIEETLRLDYDTFVNASFFLQGNADQFTQQRPAERKRILGMILGLEKWETYRSLAVQFRKEVDAQVSGLDGRLQEINAELAEEDTRRANLADLEDRLRRAEKARAAQEGQLQSLRKILGNITEQENWVASLARQVGSNRNHLTQLETRLRDRVVERNGYASALEREENIRAAYKKLQELRKILRQFDETATQYHASELQRQECLGQIENERTRLESERNNLFDRENQVEQQAGLLPELQEKQIKALAQLEDAKKQFGRREELASSLREEQDRMAQLKATNDRLYDEMHELRSRIDRLEELEDATCPFCGQQLSSEDRIRLIEELTNQGTAKKDSYYENKTAYEQAQKLIAELKDAFSRLGSAQDQVVLHNRLVDQLDKQCQDIQEMQKSWEMGGANRLAELEATLADGTYAQAPRQLLDEIDAALVKSGYSPAAHQALRDEEAAARQVEEDLRKLENAQAALAPLNREITDLEAQVLALQDELTQKEEEHQSAAAKLAADLADLPDLGDLEHQLLNYQEEENHLRMQVGSAKQSVNVLANLKERRRTHEAEREVLVARIAQYKQLERAFGKDGVPALLIEQALPQIETRANEILYRLSNGAMTVHFETQRDYKDKNRDDKRETLDILISDVSGVRDYEMYSGGEAFRVNFAIRLALSEVLAQRAGARLQTLVIDEGFGSQDAIGRQRLVEAINMIQRDFAKILVITHIDELKDAFPTRIEVEKTSMGSTLRVV